MHKHKKYSYQGRMYQAKQLLLQMLDAGIFVTLASCNFSWSKIHSETIIIILYNPYFNIFCFFRYK